MNHQGQSSQQSLPNSSSAKTNNALWGSWTDDLVNKLVKLFEAKLSAKEIAAELKISRNAVLGKLHRMGLKSGTQGRHPNSKPSDRPKLRIVRANSNSNAMRVLKSIERASLKLKVADTGPRGLQFAELGADDCRYPYGDNPFTYCGHPRQPGSSYCAPHHALCWMAPTGRNQRARGT